MGTVTIRGKEYPIQTNEQGREFIELEALSDGGTLYDLMHMTFKGPFKATTTQGELIPPFMEFIGSLDEQNGSNIRLYVDSSPMNGAMVVDSTGAVVANDISYIAARTIANALNKQPEGYRDAMATGLLPGKTMGRHVKESKFMFWTVSIKLAGEREGLGVGYLAPLDNRYETPAVCSSPMSSIRFRSKQGAERYIELVNDIKKNYRQIVYDRKGNEKEPSYLKVWNWDSMEPVLIQFAYNVLK